MKLVVISPPEDRADEASLVRALFEAGLVRYHLRKPDWSAERTASWLARLALPWRRRVVVHRHHMVARSVGAGGIHFRDDGDAPEDPTFRAPGCLTSRSCHDAATVKASLGRYGSVLVGPLFASLSKPGYGPLPLGLRDEISTRLAARTPAERKTDVIAIGGITAANLATCHAWGFDGAAVLGAVWNASAPVDAYIALARVASAPALERTATP